MSDSDAEQPSDTMRERVDESRTKLWLLLDADRRLIAAIPLAIVFVSLVVLGTFDPAPLRSAVGPSDPIETVFQGFLTAIITGVTLVVTINQLVLSQELGAVGDQRDRMANAMDFREDVESTIETPISPPEPSSFLRAIVDVTGTRANALEDAVSEAVTSSSSSALRTTSTASPATQRRWVRDSKAHNSALSRRSLPHSITTTPGRYTRRDGCATNMPNR